MKSLPAALVLVLVCLFAGGTTYAAPVMETAVPGLQATLPALEEALTEMHGETQRPRIRRGLQQAAGLWRADDGDAEAFAAFARTHFAGDQATLDAMFERFQYLLEQMNGHMNKLVLELRRQSDLDLGPIRPFDSLFAAFDPSAHLGEDMFRNGLAFVALLNFPLTTLDERLENGDQWTRRQWAEARLAQRFGRRVPAEVNQAIARAGAQSDQYIAEYNIWMHNLVDTTGARLFPAGMRLLAHWNLRDEIKANYGLEDPALALARQRMIQRVMEHIVEQTIPAVVIDNPAVDWDPYANTVAPAAVAPDGGPVDEAAGASPPPDSAAEADERYRILLETFRAARLADPYSPAAPTLIARRFDEDRELPEARVEAMLKQVVSSPLVPRIARLIEDRLGRPLEPFDIWYNGFRAPGRYSGAELDAIVAQRYPTAEAFDAALPELLEKLGYSPERAAYLAANIVVEPARGSGHAWGAGMRSEKAHLRTRVEPGGMNYKGYNIAIHELGHNVEQTFSLNDVDYTLLEGVPNTAFTEALAFVFQARDLELLGLAKEEPDPDAAALRTLDDFWGTFEIAGVALVDMAVWRWMYANPDATPAELKAATVQISRDIWNTYYAPVFGVRDVVLLGVYSHMIHSFLYLPDYPIGGLIAHQIEEQVQKTGDVAGEVERMSRIGSISPDLWMQEAAGAPVGAEALLAATERALNALE
ncbi:hypothetical protein [Wenzhouxiangella sp. XN24]|uniref:hypothetical protein n=1 Tax=Wenzhouxiangella sp. XN24 TaxID=2713569 RepID=UPI00198130AB|nr:hypothetical protein [Wenzhouxiangella sp. XN24]